jgi:hypothetical protein
MAAFSSGAFGGRNGKVYFSYLNLISTYEIADIEEIPFVFAFQLAKAFKAGNKQLHVADDILTDDLTLISSTLKKPIIVLFDECNVLRKNRVILEKFRNIFMNMGGYMLVFAATDDFFPLMDEVFSPIMRQFKKIEIGPFKTEDDVFQCIYKPLRNIGFSRQDPFVLVPRIFSRDADMLSGRRPYELQLICHTLFRRCQENASKHFSSCYYPVHPT